MFCVCSCLHYVTALTKRKEKVPLPDTLPNNPRLPHGEARSRNGTKQELR